MNKRNCQNACFYHEEMPVLSPYSFKNVTADSVKILLIEISSWQSYKYLNATPISSDEF